MNIINKSQIRTFRNIFENKDINKFSIFLNENKQRASLNTEIKIFLSHKHDEIQELKDAVALLKSCNVSIYIDHEDEGMPKITSGITAARIKVKIKSSKKFILLATEGSIASKWCNWELGFGDAHKYLNNIALLIFKNDNTIFSGSEYLEIYPVIGFNSNNTGFEVKYPSGITYSLESWLNL